MNMKNIPPLLFHARIPNIIGIMRPGTPTPSPKPSAILSLVESALLEFGEFGEFVGCDEEVEVDVVDVLFDVLKVSITVEVSREDVEVVSVVGEFSKEVVVEVGV